MIRLAVSDMDGCLLDPQGHLPEGFHDLLDYMEEKQCLFAAASGRGQLGIAMPFGVDADRIAKISDNGSLVYCGGKQLFLKTPEQDLLKPVIAECRKHPHLVPVLCAAENAYLAKDTVLDERTVNELHKYYPSWELIDDLTVFPEPIIKIALLYFDDIEKNIYPYFKQFDGPITVKVTAYIWIDIFNPECSKGHGVHALQEALHVTKDETIVFGDYLNDLPMKDYACRSFAPANAHPDVKAAFTDVIGPNTEGSVASVIRSFMDQQ